MHDVVIIGGGIVGLSAAYELADDGADVVVIDKGAIGTGCAVGSAGHIVPSHVVPLASPGAVRNAASSLIRRDGPLSIRWTAGPSLWRWLGAFARNSRNAGLTDKSIGLSNLGNLSADLIDSWIDRNDIRCHHATDGILDVYGDEAAFEHAVAHADAVAAHGVRVEILDREATLALEPALHPTIVGAVRFPDDGNLQPSSFLAGIRSAVAGAGVDLRNGVELTGVRGSDRTVSAIDTSQGPIAAKQVVVATGAWSGAMATLFAEKIPIVPGRGFSVTVDRPERGPSHAMLLGEQHVAVGPMGDELRMSGRFEVGEFGTEPERRRIDQIIRLARSRLDLDDELIERETWAGLRPVTPDGVPIISRSSRWDNVTIAAGHAMVGLSTGPGTGRLVAQLVRRSPTEFDTSVFDIARFH